MPITRTPMIDDDGSGTTGTIINNAWKTELYDQIDAGVVGADELLVSAMGTDTSPGVGVFATLPIAAAKLGPRDLLKIDAILQVAGVLSTPLIVDLYGSGNPNSSPLVTLTGASGVGDMGNGNVGMFEVTVRPIVSTNTVFHSLASGVLTLGLPQAHGFTFGTLSTVDNWAAGWTLHFRQISGVPAGTTVYWGWNVWRRPG